MSKRAEVLVRDRARAGGTQLQLLGFIADYADNDGRYACPGNAALAKWMRQSDRNVRRLLHKLEANGELIIDLNIERKPIGLPGGRSFVPEWFFHIRCVCEWESYRHETGREKWKTTEFKVGRKSKRKSDNVSGFRGKTATPLSPQINRTTCPVSADQESDNLSGLVAAKSDNLSEKPDNSGSASLFQDDLIQERKREGADAPPARSPEPSAPSWAADVVAAFRLRFNERTALPIPRIPDEMPLRWRKQIERAMTWRSLDEWALVFDRAQASAHCRGENPDGWVLTFDWLTKAEENALKVLDGRYDDRRRRAPQAGSTAPAAAPQRPDLPAHLDRVIVRLRTVTAPASLLDRLSRLIVAITELNVGSDQPGVRAAAVEQLERWDAELMSAAFLALDEPSLTALTAAAEDDVKSFRDRMAPPAYRNAIDRALARLVREHFQLPTLTWTDARPRGETAVAS